MLRPVNLAAAAPTCFPREEALGFYVDDRSRTPYHYSSYGTPATSDSESSVTELTSTRLNREIGEPVVPRADSEPNNNIRDCLIVVVVNESDAIISSVNNGHA